MPPETERGAYGLRLPDLPDAADLLQPAPAGWGVWRIVREQGGGSPEEHVTDDWARLRAEPDGWVELDRARSTATYRFPRPPSDRELVHPYLAACASVAAHWGGVPCFHAGAFVAGGRAWALLGERGAGKSSLLAWLAQAGVPVLTDDVLVVRDGLALAGPRCIDLREASAERLGAGEPLGVLGTRARWRLATGAVEPEVPLGGWVRLAWGEPAVEAMPADERLAAILGSFSLRLEPSDPGALMELLALPALVLRQPQRIGELDATVSRLLAAVERLAAQSAPEPLRQE